MNKEGIPYPFFHWLYLMKYLNEICCFFISGFLMVIAGLFIVEILEKYLLRKRLIKIKDPSALNTYGSVPDAPFGVTVLSLFLLLFPMSDADGLSPAQYVLISLLSCMPMPAGVAGLYNIGSIFSPDGTSDEMIRSGASFVFIFTLISSYGSSFFILRSFLKYRRSLKSVRIIIKNL